MPTSKNLPSTMCPSCAYYEFKNHSNPPHYCANMSSFSNGSKCGQDPDKEGTSSTCKTFKPR